MAEKDLKLKTDVVTPTFRASYPAVFKPTFNKLANKSEFSLEALFEAGADMKAMKQAAENAMVNKFTADKAKWPKVTNSPFRDQKEKMKGGKLPDGCVAGAAFMRFKSARKPGVFDQNAQEIIEESKFYAGCYARAHVNAFAYQKGANCGVSFGLNHVQFVKDGDTFGGRPSGESAFAPIESGDGNSASDLF